MNKKSTYQELEQRIKELEALEAGRLKAQAALEESEARYKNLFDSMPNGFYLSTQDGYYVTANPAFVRMLGYESLDELKKVYIPTDIYVHPSERENVTNPHSFTEQVQIYRHKRKDGRIIWIEDNSRSILDGKDGRVYFQGICRDITDRKHAEEINSVLFEISDAVTTTRDLEELYTSIHKSLGRIIDVTNFHISLYDRQKDTLTFVYWVDTVDTPPKNFQIHHIRNPKTVSHTAEVIITGKPVLHTKAQFEKILKQRGVNPGFSLSEIWLGVPLKIKDEIIGAVVAHSFTNPSLYNEKDANLLLSVSNQIAIAIERKRSEEALRWSEEKFRQIYSHILDVYYELDLSGTILEISPSIEKHTCYNREELIGKPASRIYPDLTPSSGLFRMIMDTGAVRDHEADLTDKDGSCRICSLNLELIYASEGRAEKIVGISRDISERKKLEFERIEAQKNALEREKLALVGQIAGKMAHDFNNVLSVIMGNTELSLMDCTDPGMIKTLELIYEQTLRGRNLTKNLVAFSKDQEPKQEFFPIHEKMELVLNLLKKDLEGIRVVREYSPDIPELLADPGMIEHAIINLIQNSIHAVSLVKKPVITARTFLKDGRIVFEIEDNGCGIPKEYMSDIFEPSFTLKGSNDKNRLYKPGIKGTGYGMPNVKRYTEQHKGNITIQSELWKGTKITIDLPIIRKELTDEEIVTMKTRAFKSGQAILIVEDEPAISSVQHRILTQAPCSHRADIAANGAAAIQLFDQNPYDLISLDYILPGKLNGMDVYHHIRTKSKTVPVLFISGNIEFLESIKELRQKDPFVSHLSKPCKNMDYLSCINLMLGPKIQG